MQTSSHILLVDHDVPFAQEESRMLERHGYRVTVAHRGSEAVGQVRSDPEISLVLMEIELGGGTDGTAAAGEILGIRELPILFLTGRTDKEYLKRVEKVTSYGIVQKACGEFFLLQQIKMARRLFDEHLRRKREIEEREKVERQLAEQQALYRHLMENSIDAVYLLDKTGDVLNVNEAACRMLGYPREELLSKSIDDIDPNYPSRSFIEFWNTQPEGTSVLVDSQHIHRDGHLIDVEVNGIFFLLNGEKYLFGVARDVSEYEETLEALRESDNRNRALLNALPDLMFIQDREGTYIDYHAPPQSDALYASPETFLGRKDPEILPKEVARMKLGQFARALETGELQVCEYELRISGKKRYFEARVSPYEEETVLCIVREITDRKTAEEEQRKAKERIRESEHRYRLLFENANEAILIFQEGETKLFNEKTLEITGYSEDEYKHLVVDDIVHSDDRAMLLEKHEQRIAGAISDEPYEYRIITKAGKTKWLRIKPTRIIWEGRPATLGMIEDITALRETEEELQEALQEKDYLMKELNHRVKNNLHMISSLVNLKDSALGSEVDLSDIKHQINAIEIIHDKLSGMDDMSKVNLKEYLLDILTMIFSDYSRMKVHIEEEIEEVTLPAKTSVPLGLITNEIATNAVKYGFTEEEQAVFTVSFSRDEDAGHYVLVLSNTGRPFPEEVNFDSADSLGLHLIQALVQQLGGTVELRKTPTPVFTIRFPIE